MTEVPTDWSAARVVERRDRYFAATLRKFTPYETPLVIKRGRGQYLWDEAGRRLIDLLAMNVCVSVGHAHPAVNRAAREQADLLPHCTTMFHHPVPAQYAEELAATLPTGADWVAHFTSSGAEAVDLALMIARAFTGRRDVIALQGSYHGPTYGAQSVTGIDGFRHEVGLPGGVQFAPAPDAYRGRFGADPEPYLAALEDVIRFGTSGRLAGMILEPVQGYGGIISMPDGYVAGAAERARAAGGLLVIDEVQSGVGRTGDHFWAFERHGVVPDIVVMAKGIANGYPLGAVLARREVAEPMAEKMLFHTYGSNPMSCAVGRAVLRAISEEGLQENARRVGGLLRDGLMDLQQRHAVIGDVRARGLMLAVELVKDRATREPAAEETARVFEETRRQGLVVSKSGAHKSVLRLVPPLCIAEADIPEVLAGLDRSLQVLEC